MDWQGQGQPWRGRAAGNSSTGEAFEPKRVFARWLGARGRNRTGTPCGGGFSYHFGFRRQMLSVRGLEHAFTIAESCRRCPPSALYTFSVRYGPELGSALARTFVQGLHRV